MTKNTAKAVISKWLCERSPAYCKALLPAAVVGGLSPYANLAIKNATTDSDGNVNSTANLMAHALLGAIEAKATGNNALAGATGAVGAELTAQLITEQLYGKNAKDLTEAQKETVFSSVLFFVFLFLCFFIWFLFLCLVRGFLFCLCVVI